MSERYRRFIPFFLAALALATVFPGLFLSFEDSEIWGITSSRRFIDDPFTVTSAHFKPLFSFIFGSVVALAPNDWSALVASRWFTMAFTAAGLYSLYSLGLLLLSSSKTSDERSGFSTTVWFFALVGTLPLFVVNFPKSRSDTIATGLVLVASLLLRLLKTRTLARRWLYLCSSIAAMLVTPKSIDLVVILGLFFRLGEKEDASVNVSRPASLVWLVSPLLVMSTFAVLASREILVRALVYWVDSYHDVNFASASTWSAVLRAVVTGPVVTVFLVTGSLIGLARFTKLNPRERTLVFVGGVALTFILLHSQKYFFFLASRVPFLALGALPGIHHLSRWISSRFNTDANTGPKVLAISFFISLLVTVSTLHNYSGFYLHYQKAVYQSLASYMSHAEATHYWDAIGLFPKRNTIFHYPSPGDETNKRIIEYVEHSRPNLVLRSSKMELLEPDVITWLSAKYIPLGDQIFIRYLALENNHECHLGEEGLRKQLEGQRLKPPFALFTKLGYANQWLRIPINWTSGAQKDSLDSLDFGGAFIELAHCDREGVQYAITEAKPWDALPAPMFSQFFGYDGTL